MRLAAVVVDPLALALLADLGGLTGVLELDMDMSAILQKPVIRGELTPRICDLPAVPSVGFCPGDHSPFNAELGH